MKGIILAGGSGTRLYPNNIVCKQLMPIYSKPMIYYPLATLMEMGIKDILIISTPKDTPTLQSHFQDGRHLGMKIEYAVQAKPEGLAQAFLIGEEFIGDDNVTLILGDNLFWGLDLSGVVEKKFNQVDGALIFGYKVSDPERYGVVEFDAQGRVLGIEEKPSQPKSNYAVPGLYVYDNDVVGIAKQVRPSDRGELEITDVNNAYLNQGRLHLVKIGRSGKAWLDTGTTDSLHDAENFVAALENRTGTMISCIEQVALTNGWIDKNGLRAIIESIGNAKCDYVQYLQTLLEQD